MIGDESELVVTVMRWYAQDEVNQEDSEQNEVERFIALLDVFSVKTRASVHWHIVVLINNVRYLLKHI